MVTKIVEVRTVHGDGQANKLMEEDWELYTALDPIPKFGVNSPHGDQPGASYVLVKLREVKSAPGKAKISTASHLRIPSGVGVAPGPAKRNY